MNILLNGEERAVPDEITVADLLGTLQLVDQRVAVECNGVITPRSLHPATHLQPGDRVEIVQAIGGG